MNILKRSFLYLIRKKVRSILLFLILFVTGLFLMSGLSIRSTTNQAAEKMRSTIPAGLKLEPVNLSGPEVYDTSYNEAGEIVRKVKLPLITLSVAKELASLPGVNGYYSSMGSNILYTGLHIIPNFNTEYKRELEQDGNTSSDDYTLAKIQSRANRFLIVEESESHPYFRNGAMKLVAGHHLHTDDNKKVLISEEIALKNHLTIGDSISGQSFDFMTGQLFGDVYQAEIAGIFRTNFEQQLSDYTMESDILSNAIFAPLELVHWDNIQYNTFYGGDVLAAETDPLLGDITLFVDDPDKLEEVEEAVKAYTDVDWNYYTISRDDSNYKSAAGPLLTMTLFAAGMAVIMIAAALLILLLVITMWTRDRRQEIRILTFLGLDRNSILGQFLLEIGIITAAAFLAAILIISPVINLIGDTLTDFTNPSEGTPSFQVDFEPETQLIHVNRAPIRQDYLSYHVSCRTALVTLFSMSIISITAVILAFRKIQKSIHLVSSGRRHLFSRKHSTQIFHTRSMHSVHRAVLYLMRNPGKSALLLLALSIITGLFLAGVSVRSASLQAASTLRESLSGYFTLSPDYENEDFVNEINKRTVSTIADIEGVSKFNAMDLTYMDVQNVSLSPGRFTAEGDEKYNMTRIHGNTDSSLNEYFTLDFLELSKGRHIGSHDKGKALISTELAEKNHLNTGDSIILVFPDEDVRKGAPLSNTYKLEITGLFSESEENSSSAELSSIPECDIFSNFIFTDISTTQKIQKDLSPEISPAYSSGAVFLVKDPGKISEILASIEEEHLIDTDITTISVNNNAYQNSIEPLNRLCSLSIIILVVSTVAGIIILTLILTLWERNRVRETGILMCFGISEKSIWFQRITECICVFSIALILTVSLLLPVSNKTGDWLYKKAEESIVEMNTEKSDFIENDVTLQLYLSPASVLLSGLSGVGLVGISVSIAFLFHTRHRPKKLLSIIE